MKILGYKLKIDKEDIIVLIAGVVVGRFLLPVLGRSFAGNQGDPGFYTAQGHHHCFQGTAGCICTDPSKCSTSGNHQHGGTAHNHGGGGGGGGQGGGYTGGSGGGHGGHKASGGSQGS